MLIGSSYIEERLNAFFFEKFEKSEFLTLKITGLGRFLRFQNWSFAKNLEKSKFSNFYEKTLFLQKLEISLKNVRFYFNILNNSKAFFKHLKTVHI